MPHNCPMWSPTWGNSAETSDSGSCGPTLLASAVGVIDGVRLSLGYEPHDAGLRRLACSPTWHLALAVVLLASLGAGLRLRRSTRSRRASCANACTPSAGRQVISLVRHLVGYPGIFGTARVCRPGSSDAGLCLHRRGDDPFASSISDGRPRCGSHLGTRDLAGSTFLRRMALA